MIGATCTGLRMLDPCGAPLPPSGIAAPEGAKISPLPICPNN
jgi:hypothetical protein